MSTIRIHLLRVEEIWVYIRNFPEWFAKLRRAAKRFNVSSLEIWKRAIVLRLRYGLGPDEAVDTGLINPDLSPDEDPGAIGRWRLTRHQYRFSPRPWECLSADKAVFYAYCKALGLPVPKLYAVLDKDAGWTASGKLISERAEWERFFENDLPQEFIIKPALGARGRGVNLYRRAGASFQDLSGQTFSAASLYERLRTDSAYTRFVIQERLFNHPEIQRLTGTQSLQTVRVQTWITKDGEVELYETHIKMILGNNLTDNVDGGRSGNMRAELDMDSGALAAPFVSSPDGIGFKILPVHPVTGINITGTVLPHWSSFRQLVDRAAHLFLPIRTIGWDIAITSDGPVLIEGNTWYDGCNHPHWSLVTRRHRARFISRFTNEL